MADESNNAATPDNGAPDPTPEPTPTPPAAEPTPPAAETYTQADIDRIVKERLDRERKKYSDYNDLKKAADELQKLKDAQLTEQERLQKQLAEAEAKAEKATQMARQKALFSAVVAEAAKLNFHDPAVAAKLIGDVEYDDNGNPKGVEAAVKELAEKNPYLIKRGQQQEPFDPGGGQPQKETDAQRRARIYGGGGNWFNPETAEATGGGVIWPKGSAPEE